MKFLVAIIVLVATAHLLKGKIDKEGGDKFFKAKELEGLEKDLSGKIQDRLDLGTTDHTKLASSIEGAIKHLIPPDAYIQNRIKIQGMAAKLATAYNTGAIAQYNTRASQEKFLA